MKRTTRLAFIIALTCVLMLPALYAESDDKIHQWTPEISAACGGNTHCIALMKAFIKSESDGKWDEVSFSGCVGLTQLCYSTAYGRQLGNIFPTEGRMYCCPDWYTGCGRKRNACKDAGYKDPRFDPALNIHAGTKRIMRGYVDHNGNLPLAAIAYVGGPVIAKNVVKLLGKENPTLDEILPVLHDAYYMHKGYRERYAKKYSLPRKIRNTQTYINNILRYTARYTPTATTTSSRITQVVRPEGTTPPKPASAAIDATKLPSAKQAGAASSSSSTSTSTGTSTSTSTTNLDTVLAARKEAEQFRAQISGVSTVSPLVLKQRIGTYSLRPTIKATVSHKQDEYQKLKVQVQSLITTCGSQSDVKSCLEEQLPALSAKSDFSWKLGGCDVGLSKFENAFREQLQECLASPEQSCLCTLSLPIDLDLVTAEHTLTLRKVAGTEEFDTLGESGAFELVSDGRVLDTGVAHALSLEDNGRRALNKIDMNFMFTSGDLSRIMSKAYRQELGSAATDLRPLTATQEPLRIKKEGSRLLFEFNNYHTDSATPQCGTKKQSFRFCVQSPTEAYAYDAETDSTYKRNLMYRFALAFQNGPPPLVTNVQVRDAPKHQGGVLLSWDQSPDNDIARYRIYYAPQGTAVENKTQFESAFRKVHANTPVSSAHTLPVAPALDAEPECILNNARTTCTYMYTLGGTKYALASDTLYHVSSEKRFVYILSGLVDTAPHTFTVVAEDTEGNYITAVQSYPFVAGAARDDLAPGMAQFTAAKNNGALTLTITPPFTHSDGSKPVSDIARYNVYISSTQFTDTSAATQLGNTPTTQYAVPGSVVPDTYYMAVTAVDGANNEFLHVESQEVLIR